jgi:adenine-specific DNA-methyltransferase
MSGKTAQAKPEAAAEASSENGIEAAQPEKFDLRSHSISEEKRRELLRLFPESRTEGEKIDFNRLKLALGETVETGKERYGLTWPGKADCFKTIQTPSLGTLMPVPEKSVNWDTTENLIIEGDNLEVLKLLQKSYIGQVKMIYIDPPYNTGNDFIYPDDYAESLQTYLEYTGQVDSQGKKFSTNSDSEGRFHSKWLNMMYPRLYLARVLLSDEGVAFISIDDGEVANLVHICDEVFGEENRIAIISHKARASVSNDKVISSNHNFILLYARNQEIIFQRRREFGLEPDLTGFDREDETGKFKLVPVDGPGGGAKGNPYYTYRGVTGYFRFSADRMKQMDEQGLIVKSGNSLLQKYYLARAQSARRTDTTWWDDKYYTSTATSKLNDLLGAAVFDNPKPVELIQRMLRLWVRSDGDVVLDFFAGSGTTAHAVIGQNRVDGINRSFVLVQLPEPTPVDSEARKSGFSTISALCEERVRRAVKESGSADGFRIYKLAESNLKVWDSARPEHPHALQRRLTDHVHHIREGRSDQDILTELLLKSGFPPTIGISEVSVGGKKAFKVSDGRLLVCLDRHLTLEAIRAIADLRPERVVCLDEGFEGNDQLKVNAAQTFKTKGVTSFQTV